MKPTTFANKTEARRPQQASREEAVLAAACDFCRAISSSAEFEMPFQLHGPIRALIGAVQALRDETGGDPR